MIVILSAVNPTKAKWNLLSYQKSTK